MDQRKFPYQRVVGFPILLPLLVFVLNGCEYINMALPPTISPVPTLARLPTTTPEPPTPSPIPTYTPRPPTPIPSPTPLMARVIVQANVRAGAGMEYPIVSSVQRDGTVVLLGRTSTNWYQVVTPEGLTGWMAESVLAIEPEVATVVPTVVPSE